VCESLPRAVEPYVHAFSNDLLTDLLMLDLIRAV
jgi:hypothetical protein